MITYHDKSSDLKPVLAWISIILYSYMYVY